MSSHPRRQLPPLLRVVRPAAPSQSPVRTSNNCRQWLHDRKCNSWHSVCAGCRCVRGSIHATSTGASAAHRGEHRLEVKATQASHRPARLRHFVAAFEPVGGRGRRTNCKHCAAVTVTQKSRRCGLRRQPAVLIERSPTQPACGVPHRGVCVDGLLSTNGVRGVAEAANCGVGDGPSRRTSGAAQWGLCREPWRSRRSFSRRSFFHAAHTRRN